MNNASKQQFENFLNTPSKARSDFSVSPEYERNLVAFIDILGMSEYMRNIKEEKSDAFSKYENIKTVSEIFRSVFNDDKFSKMEISDSFVVSVSNTELTELITHIAELQLKLLVETDFLVRGAITYNNIIINIAKNRIIGPAFVEAHDLEAKVVIYPRVILDKSVIENNKINEKKLRKDSDGYLYINYLSNISDDECIAINELIKTWDSNSENEKVAISQKRNWFKNYFNQITQGA